MADYKKDFLDTVAEQIAYKPLRRVLGQELKEHIYDRTEEYEAQGISREEAERQAVRDMGDPVVIGTQLIRFRRRRPLQRLLFFCFSWDLPGLPSCAGARNSLLTDTCITYLVF